MAGEASSFGRNFARTGGVTESVAHTLELSGLDLDVKAVRCNGIDECIKAMKMASFGKLDANFIEGMACEGGCVGGPSAFNDQVSSKKNRDTLIGQADDRTIHDNLKNYDMESFSMHRE